MFYYHRKKVLLKYFKNYIKLLNTVLKKKTLILMHLKKSI